MKRKVVNVKILALLLLTLFVTNSCSDLMNNPMQDKETGEDLTLLLLDLNFFDTKITFYFVDSLGNDITEKLNVSISGEDADKIVDFNGDKLTEFVVDNGFLELAIDPSFTPSEEDPIEITISAYNDDFSWDTPAWNIIIVNTGINDELIELTYFSDEDAETGETEELKSALLVKPPVNEPFKFAIATRPVVTYRKSNFNTTRSGGYIIYNRYILNGTEAVRFTASDLTDNTILKYGYLAYVRDKTVEYVEELGSDGVSVTHDPVNMVRAFTTSIGNYTSCTAPLYVFFDIDASNASAKFNYKLTYADGTTKKGILTLVERKNRSGESEGYYSTITGIAYPTVQGAAATIQITGDSQYDLEYNGSIANVCGGQVNVTVTPKTNTFTYDLNVVLNCEGGLVGAAPSLLANYWKEGDASNKTRINFNGGSVGLRLEKNQNYRLSGSYNGESREFGFSTNPANAQSFGDAIANSEDALSSVTITVTEPTDTKNGTINVTVTYNSADCPF